MKNKILILLVFFIIISTAKAQNYSYLNASTGNRNEFPTDGDTNIYMFYGSKLVKTDKNFNTTWTNTYSGINFTNLLLSQTGSIFFIGQNTTATGNVIGKLKANGAVDWVENLQTVSATLTGTTVASYALDCKSFCFDRNNNVIFTGNASSSKAFLLKTDTNGTPIKLRLFDAALATAPFKDLSIIQDSAGIYKMVGTGMTGVSTMGLYLNSYSDITDVLTSTKIILSDSYYNFNWSFIKSKYNNNFYVRIYASIVSLPNNVNQIFKYTANGDMKWERTMNITIPTNSVPFIGNNLDENQTGDLLYASSTSNTSMFYTSAFVKLDSNGVADNYGTIMLNGYNLGYSFYSSAQIPNHRPHSIQKNKYFFDIYGYNFPSNPLTVQQFNSSFLFSCSNTLTCSNTGGSGSLSPPSIPVSTIQTISSSTISAFSTVITPGTFTVNPNFCLVLGVDEKKALDDNFSISPNPSNGVFNVEINKQSAIIEVYNCLGNLIFEKKIDSEKITIDLRKELPGIYFIKIADLIKKVVIN